MVLDLKGLALVLLLSGTSGWIGFSLGRDSPGFSLDECVWSKLDDVPAESRGTLYVSCAFLFPGERLRLPYRDGGDPVSIPAIPPARAMNGTEED